MIKREQDGIWIEFEETIHKHHEEVFGCFIDAGQVTRWFPVSAKVDLRVGGTIVFGWNEEMTRTTTISILDYDAGGRVTWDWVVGATGRHAPIYWHVEPQVEKGSVVHFRQGPFPREIDALIELGGEAMTWRWYICNLRSALEAKHDMRKVRPL